MKAEEVVRYLQDNPAFFEEYAEVLAQIYIPHPHGGRAIPIAERQILTLREKSKMLEKLAGLIQFGEENDAIGEKMHDCASRCSPRAICTPAQSLYYNLREDSPCRMRRCASGSATQPAAADRPEFAPVSEDLRRYAASLEIPTAALT
jgi:hypothetical protein